MKHASWSNKQVCEWVLSLLNGKFSSHVYHFQSKRIIGLDLDHFSVSKLITDFKMTKDDAQLFISQILLLDSNNINVFPTDFVHFPLLLRMTPNIKQHFWNLLQNKLKTCNINIFLTIDPNLLRISLSSTSIPEISAITTAQTIPTMLHFLNSLFCLMNNKKRVILNIKEIGIEIQMQENYEGTSLLGFLTKCD